MAIPDGFKTDPGFDAAEDHIGPFYYRSDGEDFDCAFIPDSRNCNVNGLVHGGVLMTFADFSLCLAATNHYEQESCATVSFHADFTAAARQGNLVTCRPEITRRTGSMVFVSGKLLSDGQVVMTFSAVVKRLFSR